MRQLMERNPPMLQWNSKIAFVVLVSVAAPTVVALIRRNPAIRTLFNAGAFGLVGALAGWTLTHLPGTGSAEILSQVAVTAAIVYTVNLLLVTAAIAASGSEMTYFK